MHKKEVQCNWMNVDLCFAVECTAAQPCLTKSPKEEEKVFYVFFLYRCFYQHWLRDFVSPVCRIFFPAGFWTNYKFPQLLDQLVQRIATKKNATRVLQGLYSTHGKCYYCGPEECFSEQWCYLSASMRLLLPTFLCAALHCYIKTNIVITFIFLYTFLLYPDCTKVLYYVFLYFILHNKNFCLHKSNFCSN